MIHIRPDTEDEQIQQLEYEKARKKKRADIADEENYPDQKIEERLEKIKQAEKNVENTQIPWWVHGGNTVLKDERQMLNSQKDFRAIKKGLRWLKAKAAGK